MNCPNCGAALEGLTEYGDHACAQCGLAGPRDVLEGLAARLAPAGALGVDAVLGVLQRTWEQRCDDYEPWPDGEDEAAQHVFDLLFAAVFVAFEGLRGGENG